MIEKIAVVGLGYVGLPVAVGMARAHAGVVGFDINPVRIAALGRVTTPPASYGRGAERTRPALHQRPDATSKGAPVSW